MTIQRNGFSIPSLDGLRAVSIAIVFLSHNQGFGDKFPGAFGVTVFFVLSGYLITTLLRREHETTGAISFRAFYLRRVFRILPPLYAVLLVTPLMVWAGWSGRPFDVGAWLAQCAHLANYWQVVHPARYGIEGTQVLWSLAVEEHFYLLFPAAYAALLRRRYTPSRQVQVLAAVCAAVLAWRIVLVYGMHVSTLRTALATDTRLDSLLIGCMAALVGNPALLADRVRVTRLAPSAIAGAVAILATLALRDDGLRETIRYTVQPLAIVAILRYVVAVPTSVFGRILNWRPVVWVGQKSYGFYLVHLVIMREVERHVGPTVERVALSLVFALVAAWALHALLDGPSLALRRRALARVPVRAG